MTHGILSGTIVLKGESEERFNALLADLHAELQPQTTVEITLVETMAVARWRQMRIWGIEKANMEHQMRAEAEARRSAEDDPAGEDAPEDTATRCALAFRTLSDDSRSLELINRYESRYDRQYLRAHRRFLELVDRRTPPPAPTPKEPEPLVQDTVSAKQTREILKLMPSNRLEPAEIVGRAFSPQPPLPRLSGAMYSTAVLPGYGCREPDPELSRALRSVASW